MFFGGALIVEGWGVVRWSRKSYSRPAEIAPFSRRDVSRSNKHDTFWHAVSTGYFYVLFLWPIVVSDFRPLETYKNLGLPLSTIAFIVSHADNHFYKYMYLFQIICSMQSVFIKIHVNVFNTQIWFKFKVLLLFFQIKTVIYRKKTLSRNIFEKIIELYVVHTWRHMKSE